MTINESESKNNLIVRLILGKNAISMMLQDCWRIVQKEGGNRRLGNRLGKISEW